MAAIETEVMVNRRENDSTNGFSNLHCKTPRSALPMHHAGAEAWCRVTCVMFFRGTGDGGRGRRVKVLTTRRNPAKHFKSRLQVGDQIVHGLQTDVQSQSGAVVRESLCKRVRAQIQRHGQTLETAP